MRINNLLLRFNNKKKCWEVLAPNNEVLDESNEREDAIEFAEGCDKYLYRRGYRQRKREAA